MTIDQAVDIVINDEIWNTEQDEDFSIIDYCGDRLSKLGLSIEEINQAIFSMFW